LELFAAEEEDDRWGKRAKNLITAAPTPTKFAFPALEKFWRRDFSPFAQHLIVAEDERERARAF